MNGHNVNIPGLEERLCSESIIDGLNCLLSRFHAFYYAFTNADRCPSEIATRMCQEWSEKQHSNIVIPLLRIS